MKRATILLLMGISLYSLSGWADDEDSPPPVVVKTKRSSILPRSIPRLVELTEAHSPNVQKAKNALDIAQLEYITAGRAWFPTLDLDATHGLQGTDPNTRTTPWASSVNLVANEKLYDNGIALANYEIAQRKRERMKIQYEYARDQQILTAVSLYYDWSASLQQRDVLDSKRDLLRRQFEVMQAQFKQGLKTKRDVLRIETEMRRSDLDLITANNDIDLNFQKMAAAVGLSRQELLGEDIEEEAAKPHLNELETPTDLKLEDHRQSKIFALQEKEATLQTRLVQRNYWPQIGVTGEFGYHNFDYLNNSPVASFDTNRYWDWAALVTLTYNLWDFGARRRTLEIARINERNTSDGDRQQLLDLDSQLRDVMLQLKTQRENVRMTRELLVLEQQSYAILESDYHNGRAQYLDLITNLNSLIDARSRFNASYYGLKKQQALYAFHQGVIYDDYK